MNPNAQTTDAPEAESNVTQFSNRPTSSMKAGHGIEVATWSQKGKNGDFETASIQRSYQDGNGEWQTQKLTNLNADSLLALSRAAEKAYDRMMEKQQAQSRSR